MAWRCSGSTYSELLNNLKNGGLIKSQAVMDGMWKVDRGKYVLKGCRNPYGDHPASIGFGATISAPHMHAMCLELLRDHLKPGCKVLDIGSGSGYFTAIMAHMVHGAATTGERGKAVGIDHIPELVEFSVQNVRGDCPELLEDGTLELVVGDGRLGWSEEGPYDCIHVGAASPKKPMELLAQLKPGGKLVVPEGTDSQRLMLYEKTLEGDIKSRTVSGVQYVPLTSKEHQLANAGY
ncbi:hypothetical protein HDU97_000621 [Phlyctochytrium planicorne]|nr:hypothetical protein HDU97_000621 [Phlyctochytrium planicorne]